MIVFYYIIPILILTKVVNILRVSNQTLETQYKLLALRDRLRLLVAESKIKEDDPLFLFLDESISFSSRYITKINFWSLLYITIKHKEDEQIYALEHVEKHLEEEIELKEIYKTYSSLTFRYFIVKSKYSLLLFTSIIKFIRFIKKVFRNKGDDNFYAKLRKKVSYLLMVTDASIPC